MVTIHKVVFFLKNIELVWLPNPGVARTNAKCSKIVVWSPRRMGAKHPSELG